MAYVTKPKKEEDVRVMHIGDLRKAYLRMADDMVKIQNSEYILCPRCGEWIVRDNFYSDSRFAIGVYPECKKCILAEVEQRTKTNPKPNMTKASVQKMLQKMDLPYYDSLYETVCDSASNAINECNRKNPFLAMLVALKSLPQYRGKTWQDSDFDVTDTVPQEEDVRMNSRTLRNGRKRFGGGYSNEDLMFIENEYQDWVARHECQTKAQEELFKNLAVNRLERKQAVKEGKSTKDIDKTFQELLAAQNIQPRQTGMDAFADAQTMGTLLEKWEETRPLPEIDPALKDVDGIGKIIDTFFRGHLCKLLGIKNSLTHLYERFMSKYTVKRPEYTEEDADTETVFDKIFGDDSSSEEINAGE